MKRLLNIIGERFNNNIVQKMLNIVEYIQKEDKRDIYVDGCVYEENKIDLIFLLDTGDWFYKTIRFDIAINTYDNKLVLRKGYGYDYAEYSLNQFEDIIGVVTENIIHFIELDSKKNNLNIKKLKIV